jgi:hypothetical protein
MQDADWHLTMNFLLDLNEIRQIDYSQCQTLRQLVKYLPSQMEIFISFDLSPPSSFGIYRFGPTSEAVFFLLIPLRLTQR